MPDQPSSSRVRLHAVVHGEVQGVGYRYFARREAQSRGLVGWVSNRDDGAVEVLAEGERSLLESLLIALERGPSASQVEQVDREWRAAEGLDSGFTIRY